MRIIRLTIILIALAVSGCANMTPTQKTVAWVAVGVAVTAIAVSSGGGSNGSTSQQCDSFIVITAGGSDHVTSCR